MACGMSDELKEQKRIKREIERQLKRDKKDAQRELKLLLLGAEKSGKSTFIRQIRTIYGDDYSKGEMRSYIKTVYQNIIMAICSLIQAVDTLDIQYVNKDNKLNGSMIRQIDYDTVTTFEKPCVEAIMSLWSDEGVQECYNRRREYELPESAKYFLDSVERISQPDYLPTIQDILRIRAPNSGIIDYVFDLDNKRCRLVDVGRLRSKLKWSRLMDYCENVTAIIFLVALSDYDQISETFCNGNRMHESKDLFQVVITYPWFQHISVILFLNKRDVLDEKIMYSHLNDYFPEFNGPKSDANSAVEFIGQMFFETNPDLDKIIYFHSLCAIDRMSMLHALPIAIDAVLVPNLRNSILE